MSLSLLLLRYTAVEKGMYEVVELLLTHHRIDVNASANMRGPYFAPLHVATVYKQTHLIPLLMKHGANIDAVEADQGNTPLIITVAMDDENSVRSLMPYHPNPNIFSYGRRNAMFIAAERGAVGIMQMLIDELGVGVNDVVVSDPLVGQTALHVACTFDKVVSVYYLLQCGADVTKRDSRGRTALDCAVAKSGSQCPCALAIASYASMLAEEQTAAAAAAASGTKEEVVVADKAEVTETTGAIKGNPQTTRGALNNVNATTNSGDGNNGEVDYTEKVEDGKDSNGGEEVLNANEGRVEDFPGVEDQATGSAAKAGSSAVDCDDGTSTHAYSDQPGSKSSSSRRDGRRAPTGINTAGMPSSVLTPLQAQQQGPVPVFHSRAAHTVDADSSPVATVLTVDDPDKIPAPPMDKLPLPMPATAAASATAAATRAAVDAPESAHSSSGSDKNDGATCSGAASSNAKSVGRSNRLK